MSKLDEKYIEYAMQISGVMGEIIDEEKKS